MSETIPTNFRMPLDVMRQLDEIRGKTSQTNTEILCYLIRTFGPFYSDAHSAAADYMKALIMRDVANQKIHGVPHVLDIPFPTDKDVATAASKKNKTKVPA